MVSRYSMGEYLNMLIEKFSHYGKRPTTERRELILQPKKYQELDGEGVGENKLTTLPSENLKRIKGQE